MKATQISLFKKAAKISIRIIAGLLGLIILLWIGFWVYVGLNQEKFKQKAISLIHERTRGDVQIGNISVSLIRTFPLLSLQLSKLVVRDSLYPVNKLDLLNASEVYLRISIPGLLSGSPVGKVILNEAQVNIITDSLGRTNEFVLKSPKHEEGKGPSFPNLEFRNVLFNYSNQPRHKLYKGLIRRLDCRIREKKGVIQFAINTDVKMANLGLNTKKGSYLKDKNVEGRFTLHFDVPKDLLYFNDIRVNIEGQPFYLSGSFKFNRAESGLVLDITASNVDYNKAVSFVHDSLQVKLARYSFHKPINVKVEVTALSLYGAPADVRIQSDFDLDAVDRFAGITLIKFEKGKGKVDLAVIASALAKDSVNGDIEGKVAIDDAAIRYKRRDFLFTNCVGQIRFTNNDIVIDTFSATAGQTKLILNGETTNLLNSKQTNRENLVIKWKVRSPFVHLKDLLPFISQNAKAEKTGSLDKIFADADVYVTMQTPKMQYKDFTATNVKAEGSLKESGVELDKVFFNHAGGSMNLNGIMKNGAKVNPVTIHTTMQNIDIPVLFASFNNFGQDALTAKNLKGRLSADIDYSASITDKAELVKEGSKGTIKFVLEDGELNHFAPLEDVAKKAFKKQDFSTIRFADIKSILQLTGTAFIVNPMEIRSTAVTFFVQGVYDIRNGTDMSIQLPVRNLTKDQSKTDLSDEARSKKGISIRLRAKTGEDGKLKITWDPFGRSVKNKEDVKDSANIKTAPDSGKLKVGKGSIQVKK